MCILLGTSGCVVRTPADPQRGAAAINEPPLNWPLIRNPRLVRAVKAPINDGVVFEFTCEPSWRGDEAAATQPVGASAGFAGDGNPAPSQRDPALQEEKTLPVEADTRITLRSPLGNRRRGIIIYGQPLLGDDMANPVLDNLRKRGWYVIEIPFFTTESRQILAKLDASFDEHAAARYVAAATDRRLAWCASACQAMLAYLKEHRPDVPQEPLVVLGFSAGALCAPTIAAAIHDRVKALVVVCGGTNLFDITTRTAARRSAVVITRNGLRPPAEVLQRMAAEYLAAVHLDPYYTAPYCRDIPTLVVHARADLIVPADRGEELWQRLGRPQRWAYPGGHIVTFISFALKRREIADWIEAHAGPPPAAASARPAPASSRPSAH